MQAHDWLERFLATRRATEALAAPLTPEDQQLQAMADASPTKWHRAHTTWFWETFVLAPHGVPPVDARWAYLFNSYYEHLGPRHARPKRGLLSRPSVAEIATYRRTVDGRMLELIAGLDPQAIARLEPTLELGIAHEEQHQELLLTDILAAFAESPLKPAYAPMPACAELSSRSTGWLAFDGGLVELGASESERFSFDHEGPRHRAFLEPFRLADRLVTVGEWKAFARAGGYRTPTLWLSAGWDWVQGNDVQAPLHARLDGDTLITMTLHGEREARDDEPLAHLSFYEADALARFFDARLPTEQEWEYAARAVPVEGSFRDCGRLVPSPAGLERGLRQPYGDAWEWTGSPYTPYPGYHAPAGAVGEYNGKFMSGQMVLRGGSCLSNRAHLRATYRNYWPPETRFQMTGARLARNG